MIKRLCYFAFTLITTQVSANTNTIGKTKYLYDFDHQVYYQKIDLGKAGFRISIRQGSYQDFAKQAVFLLRKSEQLCQSERFQLVFQSGIQDYERFPTEPRAYQGPLVAKLKCEKTSS